MATGDITGPKRPRYAANERFDSGDADASSRSAVEHLEAFQRALLTTPRAAGGTQPTGLIVTGFSLTLNPTGGGDSKVRINTELGIAVTANGRLVIKPAGVTVDITIPSGNQQVYIYWQETPAETAQRRFLTVTAPFVEYASSLATVWQSTYGTYVRAGTSANITPDDTVNGVTTPLLCIGVVTNTAGAITCTGYNSVTAPNGTAITNRIANIINAPAALPTRYANGSAQSLRDVVTANAYMRGRAEFLGGRTTLTAYATTSTATGALSWTEAGASWVTNELTGCVLKDSANVYWLIASNTATALTLSGLFQPGFGITGAGTPTGGAGTIYGPIANNNFGAYTDPSRSLQQMVDLWNNFFTSAGHLLMPANTHIDLPANTYLTLSDASSYVHGYGTLFMGRQGFAASGTYTPSAGCRRVVVRMCGAGGGGGGAGASAAGTGAAGGGGASGTYFEYAINGAPITGGAVTINAAGGGGVGAAAGAVGGDTTVVINGVTYTAKGGGGGPAGTGNLAPPAHEGAGAPTAGSSAGDFTCAEWGRQGFITGNAGGRPAEGGHGGGGRMGIGGTGCDTQGNGTAGTGYGAGGGGGASWNGGGAQNGGAGAGGVVFIDEYR